jgi:hypothetical protein
MANLAESPVWENGVYQIERTDVVDAGVAGNGIANLQAKLLANRTAYLKQVVDAAGLGTGGLDSDLVAIAQLTTTPFGRAFLTLVDAAAARTYINAQPLDADLTAIAALVTTAFGRSFLEQVDVAAARTYINAQPLDADLTAIAALVTTAFGRGFLGLADAAAARAYISAQAQNINLDSIAALVTTAFGRNLLTLADAAGVRGYLSAQQQDADLDAIAALLTTAFGRSLLTLADAAAGRTALSAQQQDADLDAIAALAGAGLLERVGTTWQMTALGNGSTSAICTFGGNGAQGNFVATNGQILDEGSYYYNDFTVAAGITITISRFAKIYCSGNVVIAGTINVSAGMPAQTEFITNSPSTIGGWAGLGLGAASGVYGGNSHSPAAQPYGSSGASGFVRDLSGLGLTTSKPGSGGGGLEVQARGTILISGTISANGANAAMGIAGGSADISGSGGGSGGFIGLFSLVSITVSGTLSVRGGNGSNAIGNAVGGGGAAGGWLYFAAPVITTTGATLQLTGGIGGTSSGTANLGAGAGAGFGGTGGIGATAGSVGRLISKLLRLVA